MVLVLVLVLALLSVFCFEELEKGWKRVWGGMERGRVPAT